MVRPEIRKLNTTTATAAFYLSDLVKNDMLLSFVTNASKRAWVSSVTSRLSSVITIPINSDSGNTSRFVLLILLLYRVNLKYLNHIM